LTNGNYSSATGTSRGRTRYFSAKTDISKPIEAIVVSTRVSSKSSVATIVTSEQLMNRYNYTCGHMGFIDTIDNQEFKELTQQHVWQYFKLVKDEDQYNNFGTSLDTFISSSLKRNSLIGVWGRRE
jgi:hypothetical protein